MIWKQLFIKGITRILPGKNGGWTLPYVLINCLLQITAAGVEVVRRAEVARRMEVVRRVESSLPMTVAR